MAERSKREADREYVRKLRAEIDESRDGQPSAWSGWFCDDEKEPKRLFKVRKYAQRTRSGDGWVPVPL